MKKAYLFILTITLVFVPPINYELYGRCQIVLPDRSFYEGECKNGIPNGKGTKLFVENGTCLTGNFINNILDGGCEIINLNNNAFFKGECKNGKPNGFGMRTYPDIGTFIGNFKDDVFEGNVTTYKGDTYMGRFINRMLQGKGKIIFNNGDYIEANFENNEPNGKVVYVYPDGSTYRGGFKDGKFNGQGYITTVYNGFTYAGYFVDGIQQGKGKITDKHGNVLFMGNFINGRAKIMDRIFWKIGRILYETMEIIIASIKNERKYYVMKINVSVSTEERE